MTRLTSDAVIAALSAGAMVLGVVIRRLAKLVDRPKTPSRDKEPDAQPRRSR